MTKTPGVRSEGFFYASLHRDFITFARQTPATISIPGIVLGVSISAKMKTLMQLALTISS